MSVTDSMKPQATIKQIQNSKFILNFILLTAFKKMVCMAYKASNLKLVLKSFEAG